MQLRLCCGFQTGSARRDGKIITAIDLFDSTTPALGVEAILAAPMVDAHHAAYGVPAPRAGPQPDLRGAQCQSCPGAAADEPLHGGSISNGHGHRLRSRAPCMAAGRWHCRLSPRSGGAVRCGDGAWDAPSGAHLRTVWRTPKTTGPRRSRGWRDCKTPAGGPGYRATAEMIR